jgi:tryptophan synthase alpha chain
MWNRKNSRISRVFQTRASEGFRGNTLSIFLTAGYPQLNSTIPLIKSLQHHGADMIEIGMPYSDPLADGPVIQQSSSIAIANGMTIKILFEQLQDLRKEVTIPILLMGYMNPVLQFGFEKFCAEASKVGIDGLIIPDLPQYEFEKEYGAIVHTNNLDFIFLVTPETEHKRIKELDALGSGFLYAVSSSATTGSSKQFEVTAFLKRLNTLDLKNPLMVGFGIANKDSFETACQYADGGIIGSAFIKALENNADINAATKSFLSSIRG